ncbi:hypothetical protein [Nocardia callitridis]|uniref:hypothetical protein n=1 Tax=Nocardia callitridis TaxID=648753 RepID=UPI0031EF1AD3
MRTRRSAGPRLFGFLVLVWIAVGLLAANQRHYLDSRPLDCAGFGTIALTAFTGPLNYAGMDPKVEHCDLPTPTDGDESVGAAGALVA